MDFILRNVDLKLWQRFKSKCAADGITMGHKIIELIKKYLGEK